jgi:hypothetical protein
LKELGIKIGGQLKILALLKQISKGKKRKVYIHRKYKLMTFAHSIASEEKLVANEQDVLHIIEDVARGPFISILSSSGANFPFVGRESATQDIYDHFVDRMNNIDAIDKGVTSILYVAGCPGTGKSKINKDTKCIVEQQCERRLKDNGSDAGMLQNYLKHSLFIHLTYSNDLPFLMEEDGSDLNDGLQHALSIRILYFYLHPAEDLDIFVQRFSKFKLQAQTVIQAVANREKVSHVHIGVDEFNKLMQHVVEQASSRLEKEQARYQGHIALHNLVAFVKSAMGRCQVEDHDLIELLATPLTGQTMMDFPDKKTLLVTVMFSGTVRDGFGNNLTGSDGKKDEIYLNELSLRDICNLIKLLSQRRMLQVSLQDAFRSTVMKAFFLVGLIPRGAEMLIAYLPHAKDYSTATLVTAVYAELDKKYKLQKAPEILSEAGVYQLLLHCILREAVPQDYKINNCDILGLETLGYVLLEKSTNARYIINLPMPWLHWFILCVGGNSYPGVAALSTALASLTETLSDVTDTARAPIEKFCINYRLAFIQMYKYKHNARDISLAKLLPVEQTEHVDALERTISLDGFNNNPNVCVDYNAKNAPGIDGFIKQDRNMISEQYRHTICDVKYSSLVKEDDIESNIATAVAESIYITTFRAKMVPS